MFERLGARRDADEAAAVLREPGAAGRSAARGGRDELTLREREVLALITEGLSNGEIADRFAAVPRASESPPKEITRGETGLFITARTLSGVI